MAHWKNPWADEIVIVPIEELALCHEGLNQNYSSAEGVFIMTVERILSHWQTAGDNLDAYILPSSGGFHCIGIRYGHNEHEYLSPFGNQKKVQALLDKYSPSYNG